MGQGDGSGLVAVDSKAGRIGQLACWEHYNPLARYAHPCGARARFRGWPLWLKCSRIRRAGPSLTARGARNDAIATVSSS
jgi:hypothetical protein